MEILPNIPTSLILITIPLTITLTLVLTINLTPTLILKPNSDPKT